MLKSEIDFQVQTPLEKALRQEAIVWKRERQRRD